MNAWGWTFLISNLVYWGVFVRLGRKGPRKTLPIIVGVVHMFLATVVSVAPLRSFFDPKYLGFGLGLLRFEGRDATLPATIILIWALASAWFVVARARGRGMFSVAAFDLLFAMNSVAATLARPSDHSIQFGDALTISGVWAVVIMLVLFAGAPLVSSAWALRRVEVRLV
jgi:hypothetical protein